MRRPSRPAAPPRRTATRLPGDSGDKRCPRRHGTARHGETGWAAAPAPLRHARPPCSQPPAPRSPPAAKNGPPRARTKGRGASDPADRPRPLRYLRPRRRLPFVGALSAERGGGRGASSPVPAAAYAGNGGGTGPALRMLRRRRRAGAGPGGRGRGRGRDRGSGPWVGGGRRVGAAQLRAAAGQAPLGSLILLPRWLVLPSRHSFAFSGSHLSPSRRKSYDFQLIFQHFLMIIFPLCSLPCVSCVLPVSRPGTGAPRGLGARVTGEVSLVGKPQSTPEGALHPHCRNCSTSALLVRQYIYIACDSLAAVPGVKS